MRKRKAKNRLWMISVGSTKKKITESKQPFRTLETSQNPLSDLAAKARLSCAGTFQNQKKRKKKKAKMCSSSRTAQSHLWSLRDTVAASSDSSRATASLVARRLVLRCSMFSNELWIHLLVTINAIESLLIFAANAYSKKCVYRLDRINQYLLLSIFSQI